MMCGNVFKFIIYWLSALTVTGCWFEGDGFRFTETDIVVRNYPSPSWAGFWLDDRYFVYRAVTDLSDSGGGKDYVAIYDSFNHIESDRYDLKGDQRAQGLCLDGNVLKVRVYSRSKKKTNVYAFFVRENKIDRVIENLPDKLISIRGWCEFTDNDPPAFERRLQKFNADLVVDDNGRQLSFVKGGEFIKTPLYKDSVSYLTYMDFKDAYFFDYSVGVVSGDKNYSRLYGWLYRDGSVKSYKYPSEYEGVYFSSPVVSGFLFSGSSVNGGASVRREGLFYIGSNGQDNKLVYPGQVGPVSVSKSGCRISFPWRNKIINKDAQYYFLIVGNLCQ